MKKALVVLALFVLGVGGGLIYVKTQRGVPRSDATPTPKPPSKTAPGACAAHGVPVNDCPWCDERLIETKGQCGGHGVPEALCSRCNASLIPGFKAASVWCASHGLPESQCKKCQGGDLPPGESPQDVHNTGPEGAFCGAHQIAEASCPWCDASLIKSMGQCGGHGVPEALCSRCNPALIPGFKAEGDWCAGHGLPESQCKKCQSGDLPPGERKTKEAQ